MLVCLILPSIENGFLEAFYKFLLKTKQLEVSPLLKHKALKSKKSFKFPFQKKKLWSFRCNEYTTGFEGIRNKLVIDLFYTTGMRQTVDGFENSQFRSG
jgi:integrase/recombinase XerC